MRRLIILFISIILYSCVNFDASEEYMEEDCKCEGHTSSGNFFVKSKNDYVEPCAKTINGKLKFGYILTNDECEDFFPFEFDGAFPFYEGLAGVQKDLKWGFIDTTGKIVLPYKYKDIKEFGDGLCAVQVDSLWGIINKKGRFIVSPKFKDSHIFSATVCFVQLIDGQWGLINEKGNLIPSPKIDYIENIWPGPDSQTAWVIVDGNRIAFVAKNHKYAFLKDINNWNQVDSMDINKFSVIPNN